MRRLFLAAAAVSLASAGALAQNTTAVPNYGSTSLQGGFGNDPYTVNLTAGGPIDAASSPGGSCVGDISNAPDFELTFSPGTRALYLSAVADRDVSLVVNLPDGSWLCDDDSAGNLNPGLTLYSPDSGVYDIWVGDLSGAGPAATLYISELGYQGAAAAASNAVDLSAAPYYGSVSLSSGFSGDPYSVSLSAGGANDASTVAGGCTGMIGGPPDFNLTYSAGSLPLYISASSGDDLTLVVNAPNGSWYCDDDSGAGPLDPGVTWTKPASGTYNIWVGRLSTSELVDATLHISEIGYHTTGSSGGSSGIDAGAAPVYGDVTLSAGFTPDPYVLSLTPGGSNDASSVDAACAGQVGGAPDLDLYYTSGTLPLYIYVEAGEDTTLVINTPAGEWICDDDSGVGLNPGVAFKAPSSGLYDIWVGRFGDAAGSATLKISEVQFPRD